VLVSQSSILGLKVPVSLQLSAGSGHWDKPPRHWRRLTFLSLPVDRVTFFKESIAELESRPITPEAVQGLVSRYASLDKTS